jgi:hypothetical protein
MGAVAAVLLGAIQAQAEPVVGAERLLCASTNVGVCVDTGECEVGPAWTLDLPEFIEIDLDEKTLATTAASGENRVTRASTVIREGTAIILQGVEHGRAYGSAIGPWKSRSTPSASCSSSDGRATSGTRRRTARP